VDNKERGNLALYRVAVNKQYETRDSNKKALKTRYNSSMEVLT